MVKGEEHVLDVTGGKGVTLGWWSSPKDYSPRWSPNGKSILVSGNLKGNRGLHSIDVMSGHVTPLVSNKWSSQFMWSQNGKAVYYLQNLWDGPFWKGKFIASQILSRELQALTEEIVYEHPGVDNDDDIDVRIRSLSLSPDGQELAVATGDTISTISVEGGTARQLLKLDGGERISAQAGIIWTPIGNSVIFGKTQEAEYRSGRGTASTLPRAELWKVSAESGRAVKLDVPVDRIHQLCLHPDGKHITYCRKPPLEEIPGNEVWVIEDLLPVAAKE
jgi:Tol biopolymer transport system component